MRTYNINLMILLACLTVSIGHAGQVDMMRVARAQNPFAELLQDSPHNLRVELAPEWSGLFQRTNGWTGADGIYSMPFSGVQSMRNDGDQSPSTFFTFGDTYHGSINPETGRFGKKVMRHYSVAVLSGEATDPNAVRFLFAGIDATTPNFKAGVDPLRGMNFWLQDGLVSGGNYYSQAMCIKSLSGNYPWWTRGTVMIKAPIGESGPDFSRAEQFQGAYKHLKDRDTLVYFGVANLENTVAAGWKDADGYVYVYGRYEKAMRPFNPWLQMIELVVARVRPEQIADLSAWRYWTGTEWSTDINEVASLGLGGAELSVTPIESGTFKGKYLLIAKAITDALYYRVGDTPWGPFGQAYRLPYQTPEEEQYGFPCYTYNAKAHPHLSTPGRLLVSYNVNDPQKCGRVGGLYAPRFLWVDYSGDLSDSGKEQ